MKVLIDSYSDIQYASFYIYGLYQVYGRKNVTFSSMYFKKFKHNNHFFAFVIIDNENSKKVIIDYTDSSKIVSEALNWCDVYGKINLDKSKEHTSKIIAIGPSFGNQIYSFIETLWFAFTNFLRAYKRIPNKKKFLSDYKAQYKRPKFSDYSSESTKANYVFFMASLWKQENTVNNYRANFIKSCRTNKRIEFEGGFAPRTKNDIEGFEGLTSNSRMPMNDYLTKLKQSIIAFNTTAVKKCHGWKLAEYLCLGKAIISTPLTRVLPDVLKDQVQLLFTDGSIDDITNKVNEVVFNPKLRRQLEENSKTYFEQYLAPKQIIKSLTAL